MAETEKEPRPVSGVAKAAQTAQAIRGAVKAGKSIANAARGAAAGGPYGAVALALWENRKTVVRILAAVLSLLLLPILVLMSLPSLAFGGMDNSAALRDPSAISENVASAETILRTVYEQSHSEIRERIQEEIDLHGTGIQCTINDPYEAQLPINTAILISQYSVYRGNSEQIDLADFQAVITAGREGLFGYTPEFTQADSDPNFTAAFVTYTVTYAGDDYFADHVFFLSDEQKQQAEEYAENLTLLLAGQY